MNKTQLNCTIYACWALWAHLFFSCTDSTGKDSGEGYSGKGKNVVSWSARLGWISNKTLAEVYVIGRSVLICILYRPELLEAYGVRLLM